MKVSSKNGNGVTVEASSPALIERTGSATTDNAGQHRIVNLSPGVCCLIFQGRLFKVGG